MRKKTLALAGVVIAGASYLAGILTAPKSGKETRKEILDNAVKTKIAAEKKLKLGQSELNELISQAEKQKNKLSDKAKRELENSIDKAKNAREKAREVLSAIRDGDVNDPNLQAAIEEVKLAKKNLVTYLKK
jgi:gas vesicle protein